MTNNSTGQGQSGIRYETLPKGLILAKAAGMSGLLHDDTVTDAINFSTERFVVLRSGGMTLEVPARRQVR